MTPVMDDYGLCLDVWESEARKDNVAGHGGENWGFLTSWVFSRKKDICVAVMYNNVTEAADEAMNDIACEIEQSLQNEMEREVPSSVIGEMVMTKLKGVDEVAYVRFASVYRQFKDISTFMSELNKLLADK